jgi:hypothetical protein
MRAALLRACAASGMPCSSLLEGGVRCVDDLFDAGAIAGPLAVLRQVGGGRVRGVGAGEREVSCCGGEGGVRHG